MLANPNNPDGRLRGREELHDLIARRGRKGWLIVDEAFADTNPALSVADEVAEGRRLLIFRSFGKYFGLAGVRLGFVVGPPSFLAAVRQKLGAWPLSAAAIAIGTAAYRDRDWISRMRLRLTAEAVSLDTVLSEAGLRPIGACPLFRLVETDNAQALFETLAARAILTRPFIENPRWLRFGLPADENAFVRLKEALVHG
ncbi:MULTISPECIES: aminotransferase class I/II-fold pyridoxal phosphate-dependent enzyme [Sphingobium]|nr:MULTISPECIES: aminotransferase class I/II-fold pyridoxal phosphate-dependent enzyme [Sphingobium]